MDEYRVRVRIFSFIILVVLGILGGRLAQLQIVDWREYTGESRMNSVREIRVQPARGSLYDRNNILMVSNEQTFALTVIPRNFDEKNIGLLARLLEVPDTTVRRKVKEARDWSSFRPSRIFREVPEDRLGRVLENLYRLPGINYEVEQKRKYVSPVKAAHAFGYIREISSRELKQRQTFGYQQGDMVGQTGIERNYEGYLRGRMGSEFKLVNIKGLEVRSIRGGAEDRAPMSGFDLVMGMDSKVQALAESLFVGKRGAAVAIDPNTGEIIAFLSKPDYDPAIFSQSVSPEVYRWLGGKEKPMYNRATQNLMPPGSTWKPFMALLGLNEGNITPTSRVNCPGYHPLGGGVRYRCMHVHGSLAVRDAIQHSCNTFFFEMMMRTDVNTFHKYAEWFGFGQRLPIEIAEQTAGLMPDSAYFNRNFGAGVWGPGWTINLGIGQGNMGVTPLQMAVYMASIANGGTRYAPHLVRSLRHPETGETIQPVLPAPFKIPIKKEYFDLVRDGMRLVMEAGTGRSLQVPGIKSGGKTGTAQSANKGEDDSLFIMFAPFENPKIAVAVQVENGGFGAQAAGPIASLMVEQYLKGKIDMNDPSRKYLVDKARAARSQAL